jgi:hypothetical protein
MLPMFAIQVPLAILTSAASALLYLTVFSDETYPAGGIYGVDEAGRPLFALALIMAINGLFAFVAQGATVMAIAGAVQGKPRSVSASLDPAFTRMGSLLALALMLLAGGALLVISLAGIILIPFLALRFGLAINTLMLEELPPSRALRRSWSLMSGNVLRLLGAMLITSLVTAVPLLLLRSAAFAASGGGRDLRLAVDTLLAVAEGVVVVPFAVLGGAVSTLFYLRVKGRNDGRNPA